MPAYVHFDALTSDYLFWDLCLDWTTPANSTISSTPTRVPGTPFVPYSTEVPEPGSANGSGFVRYAHHVSRQCARIPGRCADAISLVVNHVVQGDVQQGGINWVHFNLDDHGAVPPVPTAARQARLSTKVYTRRTPTTAGSGGIAIDGSGNIGVGYSVSSSTLHPQIEITGRALSDPPGTLEDEQNCTAGIGNGSQTSSSDRWGDYSAMSVDPVDQCTFYFTNEYYPTTAGSSWHTRVCSFTFAGCGQPDLRAGCGFAAVASSFAERRRSTDPSYDLRAGVLNGFTGPVDARCQRRTGWCNSELLDQSDQRTGHQHADVDRRRRSADRGICI